MSNALAIRRAIPPGTRLPLAMITPAPMFSTRPISVSASGEIPVAPSTRPTPSMCARTASLSAGGMTGLAASAGKEVGHARRDAPHATEARPTDRAEKFPAVDRFVVILEHLGRHPI